MTDTLATPVSGGARAQDGQRLSGQPVGARSHRCTQPCSNACGCSTDTARGTHSLVDEDLLRRFDVAGPRYTSYPTADRFSDQFNADGLVQALKERLTSDRRDEPVSLYVHIPFCESVCYYCACNKVITKHHERGAPYLDKVAAELRLLAAHVPQGTPASQLHLGGGSPTFLSDEEIGQLMTMLRAQFHLTADAEISIEVDPRTVDATRLAALRQLGFNRLSLGIQDFDPDVQRAVHREQSYESVAALMASARALGYQSINADLIYGLPQQTAASFARTIQQVNALRPDRIALYGYAHLPERFKPQRRIDGATLPAAGDKLQMLSHALNGLLREGYTYIGMDHFALPDDSLAIAKREGRLQRNFQGYSTQPDRDLIALGVSAISRIGAHYSQNAKDLTLYEEALAAGALPVERGLTLDANDLRRRDIIMTLMCQGRLDMAAFGQRHGLNFAAAYADELERLAQLQRDGLVQLTDTAIELTSLGWFFVRAVAMVFDQYFRRPRAAQATETPVRFSRIL
ncbi:oxygen-independent coproporphyrinogen-3 oxidase [Roseateles sp. YR242]|uniref:oxygen-independent coproporphyrinogen III oxidase n=1 Tax=Roseateles sp. YR242 TaxID=1855305 RepID=UPI0008CDD1B3|nr:oxygen-independent coproporphyrinogen III oxidase [Roseateles sp. YR242]SEK29038.1 oxygen-independent coproporphyrinogen-3 oxidase [Roseateles sp. YR242]